jgi:hypothetical protein
VSWVKPHQPWTTKELARLEVPTLDPKAREVFPYLYLERTGYKYQDKMLLNHALELITGADRPSRARKMAKRYLAHGILTFPHQSLDPLMLCNQDPQLTWRQLTGEESDRYLDRYKDGLNAWQFIRLARELASAKESIRATASRRNLRKR